MTSGELDTLAASDVALYERYDVALLDLDGVVYIGASAVPDAAESLAAVRRHGMRLAFVTNNAARTPASVAAHLTELGISAHADEVITSAQAAARYLAEILPAGAPVLVVGTVGLHEALIERGLRPVSSADDAPAAVVQGYSPTLDWALLAEGCIAIRRGLPWIATNLDPTVPSPRGPLPGNGSLVAALRNATGATPQVTGKPDPHMHLETVRRTNAQAPVVVGDRLDTDIEGATAATCPSLLVLSGVTRPRDLLRASRPHRPTYVGTDVSALLRPHPVVALDGAHSRCGAWRGEVSGSAVELSYLGADGADSADRAGMPASDDGLDALRALARAAWAAADNGTEITSFVAADGRAMAELGRLDVS